MLYTLVHLSMIVNLVMMIRFQDYDSVVLFTKQKCGPPNQVGYVFGKGKDGVLSKDEVTAGLNELSHEELNQWMSKSDKDGDGFVSHQELLAQDDEHDDLAKKSAAVQKFIREFDSFDRTEVDITGCTHGFVPNGSFTSIRCANGQWSKASGCKMDPKFLSSSIEDCGFPSQAGYKFISGRDSKLDPHEWSVGFPEFPLEAFHELDTNVDGFLDVKELAKGPFDISDPHKFFIQYDVDNNRYGSTKSADCADGYTGEASDVFCDDSGRWTISSGCRKVQVTMVQNDVVKYDSSLAMNITYPHCNGCAQYAEWCYAHCPHGYTGVGGYCSRYVHPRCWWQGLSLKCTGARWHTYEREYKGTIYDNQGC